MPMPKHPAAVAAARNMRRRTFRRRRTNELRFATSHLLQASGWRVIALTLTSTKQLFLIFNTELVSTNPETSREIYRIYQDTKNSE